MKFCVKCGNQLNDGDMFCSKCGTSAANSAAGMPPISDQKKFEKQHEEERQAELKKNIGTVRKCPFCGYDNVPLFAIKCPKCEREFNSTKVDESVKKFFDGLNNFTQEGSVKLKGTIWSKIICIWIGVDMLIAGIGFRGEEYDFEDLISTIIGLFLIVIAILIRFPASLEMKQKRNYIETFVIPNNKESVIEFLILAASQIQNGTNPFTAEGNKISFWNRVWKTKIRQTISKANILFTDDEDAQMKVKMIKQQYKIH